MMGDFLLKGRGVEKDEKAAVEWLTKAADKGEFHAMYLLATCYQRGTGVPVNKDKAIEYLSRSVDLGDRQAIALLADWYSRGICVGLNPLKAHRLRKSLKKTG